MGNYIFVRMIPLPETVPAVVLPNDDGTFDIYINAILPDKVQNKALEHELEHIRRDHLYNDDPVWLNEKEAEQMYRDLAKHDIPVSGDLLPEDRILL